MIRYLTVKKIDGRVAMISDGKNQIDETLFNQEQFSFTDTTLNDFLNAGERFVVDGKIVLKPKDEERLKKLETQKKELAALRNKDFTKEELLDKIIEIFDLEKLK